MKPAPTQLSTDFTLDPAVDGPQEIVTLKSVLAGGMLEATAVRSWVTDLDGTGLESDLVDPVLILTAQADGFAGLDAFHDRAIAELSIRRDTDYEVADLFARDP